VPRAQSIHVCSECGVQSARWYGQCPGCEAWNTLVEERAPVATTGARAITGAPAMGRGRGARAARRGVGAGGIAGAAGSQALVPVALAEVGAEPMARLSTGIGELDRVLGGGLVPGSLVLLGGAPGIGKSTLTNMVLGHLAAAGRRTLYVSAEESPEQVRLRAERLDTRCADRAGDSASPCASGALRVPIVANTDLDAVLDVLDAHAPEACVIDSVQTLHAAELSGAPGSVGQVREVAVRVMELAKARGIATILVGHVTKDGALAGPRVLEHLVDCVLQFEGERERPYRELRALKNRFGSTNEAGLFEMRQGGLVEVLDASARFVAQATRAPGSVMLATMEGSRPLLVEVQALVVPSELEQPRRVASGLDRNRLALVLAILARHGRVGLAGHDVFVNVVGGVRVDEPGVDLAIALAVASARRGAALAGSAPGGGYASVGGSREAGSGPPLTGSAAAGGGASVGGSREAGGGPPLTDSAAATPLACFGELGLTGELRWVGHPERRLQEAARHGLSGVLAPPGSGGDAFEAGTLADALARALPRGRMSLSPAVAA
jgi:DNA repair protein RadA/Sms